MSVIRVDAPPDTAGGKPLPGSFSQRLALTLDEYFAKRTKRTVPEATLRRSRQEFERCRRLMHKTSMVPVTAAVHRASRHSVLETRRR
jgi:hypothetical protein